MEGGESLFEERGETNWASVEEKLRGEVLLRGDDEITVAFISYGAVMSEWIYENDIRGHLEYEQFDLGLPTYLTTYIYSL